MEIRLNVDDDYIKDLQTKLGEKGPDLTRSALTLLNWAVGEVTKNRVILSTNEEGKDVHKLVMPSLETARSRAEKAKGT
jgi:hypothetical protein